MIPSRPLMNVRYESENMGGRPISAPAWISATTAPGLLNPLGAIPPSMTPFANRHA